MSQIDSLEIQIQSKADSVNSSLDNVVKKLGLIAEGINAISNGSGLGKFAKEAREATKGFANISNVAKGMTADIKPQMQDATKTLGDLTKKYKDLGKGFKFTGSTATIQKQIDKLSNSLETAKLRKEELEAGGKISGKGYEDSIKNVLKYSNMIESLNQQLSEMQETKLPLDFKITGVEEAKQAMESLNESITKIKDIPVKDFNYNAEAMKAVFGEAAGEIENWGQAVEKFGRNAGKILNEDTQLDFKITGVEEAKQAVESLKDSIGTTGQATTIFRGKVEKVLNSILNIGRISKEAVHTGGESFKKLGGLIKGITSKALKLKNGIMDLQKQSSKGLSLGGMLGTSILFSSVFQAIGAVKQAIKEGSDNLVQYSMTYNNSISSMVSSLTMLKNAFASAFSPILNVVAPHITSFINMISTAANKIGQFFAALTGKSMAVQAVPVVQDYAAGLDKATGGTDKLNDSSKKLKKTLSVLGFDALNQLQGQNDSGDSAGLSGGISAGGGLNAQDMFTTVPIENEISDFAKKIKNIFAQLFAPLKESWSNEGQFVIDSCKYALGEIGSLAKDVGRDFLEMWQQPETVGVFEGLLHIMGDIGLVTGNIASGLKDAWNTNSVGLQIFENIRDIVSIIVGHIRNAADYTVVWSESLDFYPLLESVNGLLEAIAPLTDTIGAGLEWFYTNVLLPVSGWTIQEAIPTFLNMTSAALTALNEIVAALQPLATWLWDSFLQPLGQWAGDAIISAMESITGLLGDFGNWVSEHQEAVQNITIAVASFFAAFKITTAIAGIVDFIAKMGGLINIVGSMAKLIGTVFNPWTLAIGGVIAAGVLLWKHWDEISAKARQVWEFVRQKFQEFDNFLQGVFTNDWTRSFGVIGEVFNVFFRNIGNIWNSIKQVFGGIITFVKGVFAGDWRTAWDGIIQIFSGIWNGLVSIVKSPINAIIGLANGLLSGMASAVNGIANMLNNLRVDIPDWVPGIGGGTLGFSIPTWRVGRIPYLYNGGVLEKGQVGILEGNGAEAVVPLEKNRQWISKVSEEMMKSNHEYSGGIDEAVLTNAIAQGFAMAMMANRGNQPPIHVDCYAELKTENNEVLARAVARGQESIDYRMNPTPQFG